MAGSVAGSQLKDSGAELVHPVENELPTGGLPSSGPTDGGLPLPPTTSDRPPSEQRYTMIRPHAQGGIGQVWLARDGDLGREVAVKELRPQWADHSTVWARFLKEARITGQLEHPGIVPVYELVPDPKDRKPFYTMRFIRGRTLSDAIQVFHQQRRAGTSGPLALRELLGAFVGVCNAVAFAHSRGVIHRDLKGQNVVLGDFGEAVVLDWGLAKVLGETEDPTSSAPAAVASTRGQGQTMQGQILGTPNYMAPEQAEGRLDLIDQRSDVYGLGAILYEILTGQPPFAGTDTVQVLKQVVHAAAVPPRQLVATTPKSLDAVCRKALAKLPADRYAAARDLGQEVQRWLADEPVAAYAEHWTARARRWLSRHRTLATATAATLLVATLILAVGTILLKAANDRERRSRAAAEANFQRARDAVDRYFTKVSESPQLKARGLEKLRRDLLQEARAFYDQFIQEHGKSPVLQADLGAAYHKLGKIAADMGLEPEAIDHYEHAEAIAERLVQEQPEVTDHKERLAVALHDQALMHQRLGHADRAILLYERAIELGRQAILEEPDIHRYQDELVRLLNDVGTFHQLRGQLEAGRAAYDEALPICARLGREHPELPLYREAWVSVHYNRAYLERTVAHQPARALPHYQQAQTLCEELVHQFPEVASHQRGLARILSDLGAAHMDLGNWTEARAAYDRSMPLFAELGRQHPDVPDYEDGRVRNLVDLGQVHWRTGQQALAQKCWDEALTATKSLAGRYPANPQRHHLVAWILRNLGDLHIQAGKWEPALAAFKEALPIRERLVREHPAYLEFRQELNAVRLGLARTRAGQGEHVEALRAAATLAKDPELVPAQVYDLACVGALGAAVVARDGRLSAADRSRLAEEYAARAVAWLRHAFAKGYRDVANLKQDTELDSLRQRSDFRKLLAELEEKQKAAGP
jgi:serine/threonine-protein kinase